MSFNQFKIEELRTIATEEFAVDVPADANKDQILAQMVESGVTWGMYERNHANDEQPEPEEESPKLETEKRKAGRPAKAKQEVEEDKVLLKMTRENGTYQVRGITFTKRHPFALVRESDADWILQNLEGFQVAGPAEAKEFYS